MAGPLVIGLLVAVCALTVIAVGRRRRSEAAAGRISAKRDPVYAAAPSGANIVAFNPYVGTTHGAVGLVYETLFRYDPLKDKYIPWLATSGNWTTPTVYTVTIRPGVKWSDGKPFTAET